MSQTPAQPPATTQPELPGLAEACALVGLESAPAGLARLTAKERAFVLTYLEVGVASEAARRAGYADPAADACRIVRRADVAAVISQAVLPVAKNADQLIRRAAERSRFAHAMFEQEVAKPEARRSTKEIRAWMQEAAKADALLGTLLGKIEAIHLTGSVKHTHTHVGEVSVIHESALASLAEIRRSVVAERLNATSGGHN